MNKLLRKYSKKLPDNQKPSNADQLFNWLQKQPINFKIHFAKNYQNQFQIATATDLQSKYKQMMHQSATHDYGQLQYHAIKDFTLYYGYESFYDVNTNELISNEKLKKLLTSK